MMENELYEFINYLVKLGNIEAEVLNRTNEKGIPYYLIALENSLNLQIGEYTLVEHHISIYADYLNATAKNRQYHYTATLINKAGQRHKLHIHYTAADILAASPSLSREIPGTENQYQPIDCPEEEAAFIALAHSYTQSIIARLREKQTEHIDKLIVAYEALDKISIEASRAWQTHKSDYLAALQVQLNKVAELITYSADNQWHAQKKILLCLAKAVFAPQKTIIQRDVQANNVSAVDKMMPVEGLLPSIIEQQKSNILSRQLEKLKNQPFSSDLFSDVQAILLDIDNYTCTVSDILALQKLASTLKTEGVNKLCHYLMTEEYDEAEKLAAFFSCLPPKMIQFALKKTKIDLLGFLLNHHILSINYKNFRVDGICYSSLIDYCFKNAQKEPRMAEILNILVKKGASLLDTDDTGMPYAALLLLDPEHSLRPALTKNANLTLNTPLFNQQLRKLLNFVSARPDCTKTMKEQIEDLLRANDTSLTGFQIGLATGGKRVNDAFEVYTDMLKSEWGDDLFNKMQADPDINKKLKQLKQANSRYISMLTTQQRQQNAQNRINEYKASKQKTNPNLSFPDLKENTIKTYDYILKLLHVEMELLECQKGSMKYIEISIKKSTIQMEYQNWQESRQEAAPNNDVAVTEIKSLINLFSQEVAKPRADYESLLMMQDVIESRIKGLSAASPTQALELKNLLSTPKNLLAKIKNQTTYNYITPKPKPNIDPKLKKIIKEKADPLLDKLDVLVKKAFEPKANLHQLLKQFKAIKNQIDAMKKTLTEEELIMLTTTHYWHCFNSSVDNCEDKFFPSLKFEAEAQRLMRLTFFANTECPENSPMKSAEKEPPSYT